jgi:RNA polymerase-binding protein DksA
MPTRLTQARIKELKERLLQKREETLKELKTVEQSLKAGSQSELVGDNAFDDEFADSGSATFERERDLSLYETLKDLLARVDRALNRIDQGTYGTCLKCGAPIPPERLEAIPFAELCVECKKKEERER